VSEPANAGKPGLRIWRWGPGALLAIAGILVALAVPIFGAHFKGTGNLVRWIIVVLLFVFAAIAVYVAAQKPDTPPTPPNPVVVGPKEQSGHGETPKAPNLHVGHDPVDGPVQIPPPATGAAGPNASLPNERSHPDEV